MQRKPVRRDNKLVVIGILQTDGFTTVAWKTSNEVYHTSNTPPLTPLFPLAAGQ